MLIYNAAVCRRIRKRGDIKLNVSLSCYSNPGFLMCQPTHSLKLPALFTFLKRAPVITHTHVYPDGSYNLYASCIAACWLCCAIVHQMTKNCQTCSILRPEVATAGDVVLRAPAIAGSGEAGSGEGAPAMLEVMMGVLVGVALLPLLPELAIKAPAHHMTLTSIRTHIALTAQ